MFHEDTPGQLAEIRQAVACRDGARLAAVAHTLKGTAGVFQAAAAQEAAFRLERAGRDAAWDRAPAAAAVLEAEIGRLAEVLTDFADRGGTVHTPHFRRFGPPVVERRG
jgi:two-component system, sensor histidine kinase and response regulator